MGAGAGVISLFLWQAGVYWCASHFLAQGKAYIKEENAPKAIESLTKAIKLNPRCLDAYLHLSTLYLAQGKPSLAVDELLKASKIFPDNPHLLAALKEARQKELTQSSYILKVGICSELNPLTTIRAVEPLLNYLSRSLQCQVELSLFSNYTSIARYLKEGGIDLAILGPEDLIRIEYQAEATPLVLVSSNKQSVQRSVIITIREDIKKIEDLRGKIFAFSRKDSLTGYILPRMILLDKGVDPEKDFSQVYFMNSQEEVFQSLLEGKVDAAGLAEHLFYYLCSTYNISRGINILAESSEIPADILAVSKNLSPQLITKIKSLLLSYPSSNEEGIFQEYTGLSIKEEPAGEGKVYTVIFAEF